MGLTPDQAVMHRLSQARHEVLEEFDVFIRMRDGVRIAVNVFRPKGEGRFPALMSISGYGKDVQTRLERPLPLSPQRGNGGQEAGDTDYWVQRGYVHIVVDSRGSGKSEGEYSFMGLDEQLDGCEIIEWAAAQPWCSGKVGMLGMSYFGVMQWLIATHQPPHLTAIAPYEALVDRYRYSFCHGGILNEGFFHQWWGHVSVGPMKPMAYRYLGEQEVERRRRALLASPEVKDSPFLYVTLTFPEKNPLLFDVLVQPLDSEFSKERSPFWNLHKVTIPCFLATRWSGWPIHLPGVLTGWENLTHNPNKKLFLMETPSVHGPLRPWRDHQDILLRWYDHWLKGIDTGMMDEPPVTYLVKGADEWHTATDWPLPGTEWTRFYLHGDGSLNTTAPGPDQPVRSFTNDPFLYPGQEVPGVRYATPELEADLTLVGPITLHMSAELDQPDATWFVTVRDIAPDGKASVITKGWLRASHREVDPALSKPWKPFHPHDRVVPVPAGEVLDYAINVVETSMCFRKGHRLALEIRGQDTPAEDPVWYHLCNGTPTVHGIHHGKSHPTYVVLPVQVCASPPVTP